MTSVTRRATPKNDSTKNSVEDRLLLAIEHLLGSGHSFTSLSINQLAREAGVSRGTFYLYFNSKGDLVARLLARIRVEIFASIDIWYQKAAGISRLQVSDATRGMLQVLKRHNAVLAAVGETAAYDPAVRKLQDDVLNEISSRSQKTMKQVRLSGKAHPDASAQVVEVLVWLTYHGGLRFARNASDAQLKKLAETFSHVFCSSLFSGELDDGS